MAQPSKKYWSSDVTEHSDALSLEKGVFAEGDPRAIARSLKASAERSKRRKASPFQSAMSMLNFFINRGGTHVDATRRRTLEQAKEALRRLYGREEESSDKRTAKRATRKTTTKKAGTSKAKKTQTDTRTAGNASARRTGTRTTGTRKTARAGTAPRKPTVKGHKIHGAHASKRQ